MGEWHLVETLVPGIASVVATDGRRKDWTKVSRLSPAPNAPVEPIVELVREQRSVYRVTVPSKSKSGNGWNIKAIPVLGPSDEAHGVQVWVGSSDEPIPPARICSAVTYLRDQFIIEQTWESSAMSGILPTAFDPIGTPVEYINRSEAFGEESKFLDMATNPEPGLKLDTQFAVRHETGRMMQWQAVIRTYPDEAQRGWRVLFQDVSDVYPPAEPSLAQIGVKKGLSGSGTHIGLFDLVTGTLVAWISEPADWMQWENVDHFGPVLHSDDLPIFHAAMEDLKAEKVTSAISPVRLRSVEHGFVETNIRITPYQPENMPPDGFLAIVQIGMPERRG